LVKIFWSKVPPEETGVCVECLNEGKHIDTECPVRPCALEKGVDSCAHCKEFICERLKFRVEYIEPLQPVQKIYNYILYLELCINEVIRI